MDYSIKLTDTGLQKVMDALGRLPYAEVAPLITDIALQAQAQAQEARRLEAEAKARSDRVVSPMAERVRRRREPTPPVDLGEPTPPPEPERA